MKSVKLTTRAVLALYGPLLAIATAAATTFNVPSGSLESALDAYSSQSGLQLVIPNDEIRGIHSAGVRGESDASLALKKILAGTGYVVQKSSAGLVGIVKERRSEIPVSNIQIAEAPAAPTSLETVTVTSSKIGGDVQNIPISITALSQEQLTATQTAGGPDLVKQVPNLTFSKTNFTGYNIEIRGIGTQAISVTTDPAVAVAFNDIPFIRNHFFEQEFYDVSQVEVLRGPQGTLYGRNATAGVVNLVSAKPTDQFEAMASADFGSYKNRRFEGMLNIPIVDDRIDLRVAGEWTKRDGYSFNDITDQPIDGRDLWSGRISLAVNPTEALRINLVWEHFSEDDDRLRSGKQLCKTAQPPTSINGVDVPPGLTSVDGTFRMGANYLSQGCEATSLYSPQAFQVPYGFSLPYVSVLGIEGLANPTLDPYESTTQSRDLRTIESTLNPHYRAKNDVIEMNADYAVAQNLTFTSQTGYNQDFLWSAEDYNRFNTSPGIFLPGESNSALPASPEGVFCDPQLGCSTRLVAEDLSDEHAWQLSQEFRLASNFAGPFNFSVGGNYLHYETEENYYVFINSLTLQAAEANPSSDTPYVPGVADNHGCLERYQNQGNGWGYQYPNPIAGGGQPVVDCIYIDPNPITNLNNEGHNYFLSQNPYTLNSYAGFGETYYNLADDLKFTGGVRWTDDQKHFTDIPSQLITRQSGYPITGVVDQGWEEFTGRAAVNWTPKFDFTDQTLIYGSFSRGYKAGGANPPGALLVNGQPQAQKSGLETISPVHPLTFKPEFINAFELGSKNTMLDGALTLNGSAFYYDYKDYQISEIVDRTSVNLNFDAKVKGAELEATWEPAPGLKFSFAGGYEDTRISNGQSAVDLMDRTDAANHPDWIVVKPFVSQSSNCILPIYVVQALLEERASVGNANDVTSGGAYACEHAYTQHLDPATLYPYEPDPSGIGGIGYLSNGGGSAPTTFPIPVGYVGFDPTNPAINNGEGFAKDLGGNKLPNAPPFTVSIGAEYTLPLTQDWAGTLRGDYYWQDYSWARVFNDNPYDRIRGYTNVNLALIFTNQDGWQVMGYIKNVFNTTAITGDFLNSDDSGLTTNVFLTDPRLVGVRVTKNW